jgi:hypothetical protein
MSRSAAAHFTNGSGGLHEQSHTERVSLGHPRADARPLAARHTPADNRHALVRAADDPPCRFFTIASTATLIRLGLIVLVAVAVAIVDARKDKDKSFGSSVLEVVAIVVALTLMGWYFGWLDFNPKAARGEPLEYPPCQTGDKLLCACHSGDTAACTRLRVDACRGGEQSACDFEKAQKQSDPYKWCGKRYKVAWQYRFCLNGSPDR